MSRFLSVSGVLCFGVALVSCASRPPAPQVGERTPVRVMAAEVVRPLLEWGEQAYERENPGSDILLDFGQKDAGLDRTQVLIEKIASSRSADVFVAEHVKQLDALPGVEREQRPWVTSRLVAVTGRGSRLRFIDLSKGDCQIAVALERTPLGRLGRLALDRRGLWSSVSDRVGRFDDARAICELVRDSHRRGQDIIGIVYAADATGADVRVIGELELPEGESATHEMVWFTPEGARFAEFLMSEGAMERARALGFSPASPRSQP